MLIVSNPFNFTRDVASETIWDTGSDWQVLKGTSRALQKEYWVSVCYSSTGTEIISSCIFSTRDEALEDVGCPDEDEDLQD